MSFVLGGITSWKDVTFPDMWWSGHVRSGNAASSNFVLQTPEHSSILDAENKESKTQSDVLASNTRGARAFGKLPTDIPHYLPQHSD